MLVLTRQRGEAIHIGKDITVTVLRIAPNGVRIGITAPPDVNIWRDELAEEPRPSKIQTDRSDLDDLGRRNQ